MFKGQEAEDHQNEIVLPDLSPMEHVLQDYSTTSLSLKAHPVSFARERLKLLQVIPAAKLGEIKNGRLIKVCGLITVRQRPGTAKGVLFITIEDETGFANLVVWGTTYEKYKRVILQSRLLMVSGKLQIESGVIHVVVRSCQDLTHLVQLNLAGRDIGSVEAGEKKVFSGSLSTFRTNKVTQGELFPSRDFK